jgi:hypothetical protein
MSDALSRAFELASKLPERDQDALGALLLEEMQSEKKWSKLFAASQDELAKLADNALAHHKAGKTKTWD